jgi:cysteine desulfurase
VTDCKADKLIYLDYAATTPVDEKVAVQMSRCLTRSGVFANPSSIHAPGRAAACLVENARGQVAALLNTPPDTVTFTSGATESDNLAIIGGARYRAHRGRHLVTMRTEHKAVLDAFAALEQEGFDVTWLEPAGDGILSIETLESALREDTQLVSIMHVNNETGVIQDIAALGSVCRNRDILFHVDAAQSAGKLPLDLAELPVDLLSLTAHKFYGPKGAGALFIANRPGCRVEPLFWGGGQEKRIRPGTVPVHQVVGLGAAAELAAQGMADNWNKVQDMRRRFLAGIADLDGLLVNGAEGYPGILNISAPGVEGESLMLALDPVCVASGSACNAKNAEPSYVLKALGRSDLEAQAAIRFSFGRYTTAAEVDEAAARYCQAVSALRSLAAGVGEA